MTESSDGTRLTDRKRAAILAAAVSEFQQYGFDGTSMDRIAAEAEVSKRTVYNHFASKDELFQAIITELLCRSKQIEDFPYQTQSPLAQQLSVIGQSIVQLKTGEDFMKLARVVVSQFLRSPEIAAVATRGQNQYHVGLVNWIQAAKKDGRLSVTNLDRAAMQFTGLISTFAFWPQLIGSQKPLTKRELGQVVKSSVAMFLDHYEAK